ncbi:MAG: hypothetical protein AAGA53_00815 [Pseudomonadota bacterium]
MPGRIVTTGASILMIATGFALASEVRIDRNVEAAAAKIAAEKLGDIRGSINHDDVPFMVTRKLLKKEEEQSSLLPRPAWVPPKGKKVLPPLVSNILSELDYTFTGSVNGQPVKQQNRIVWDKFDRYGNPIK